jgi:hypothetical protein
MTAAEMDAFDHQLRLLRFMRDPRNDEWFEVDYTGYPSNDRVGMRIGLTYGDPHYFSRPICELLKSAADQLRTPWVLAREWIPAPQGFFWYASPPSKYVTPTDNATVELAGFSWTIFKIENLHEGRVPGTKQFQAILPTQGGGSIESSDGIIVQWYGHGTHGVTPAGTTTWRYGNDHVGLAKAEALIWGMDPEKVQWEYGIADAAVLATSFQFIKQKILSISPGRQLDRNARKWITPADEVKHDPLVRVIALRRRERPGYVPPEESKDVDWSCQWLVRGFWRSQWYPSLERHQSIYVAPFMKGPLDKPLKVNTATLYAVTH